jgi:alpha-D-ribose 1-methylphosphonate 5-triphosphate synthase subunit PhnH
MNDGIADPAVASAAALSAGFADPVADAQRCFRAVLDAMARPGRVHPIRGVSPPAPLSIAAAGVLLTLVDHETPLWLDPDLSVVRDWIAFHCGAPFAATTDRACFALLRGLPALTSFHAGTHEEPETAATLIVEVAALGSGARYRLSGPGLREPGMLRVDGLPADFAQAWGRNHGQFPRGVDLVLCAGDRLAALPRSVAIEEV